MINKFPWIKMTGVSKRIKDRYVLSNINLDFEKGKIYGIVGINGSGKTMLLRAIAGLLHLSEGTVEYANGTPTMGVIIENPGFLMNYSGYENLKILARIRNVIGDTEISKALTLVGLDPGDKSKVKTYSLGMKQKLAIAQAIMEEPDVLILDEPFRGLDAESVKNIRSVLKEYNQRGGTIFLTSHNSEDIKTLCDLVYQMQEGKATKIYV